MSERRYELFFGKQSPFSHHHACKFRMEKLHFHCMEQYMMYKKAELFGDEDIMTKVMKSHKPAEIKGLGRQVKDFDILKWMKVAVDIVKAGNRAKFTQNGILRWELYKTYPKQMVEASPSDTRWGIGLSADHPNAWDESRWRGRNLLGKLLTNLRDEMMIADNEAKEPTLPPLQSDQSAIEQELLVKSELEKSKYGGSDRRRNWRSEENLQSDEFEFFWGTDSPFSTLHEAVFEADGRKFFCIEQYMLYCKADYFGDKKALETISKMRKSNDMKQKIDIYPFNGRVWAERRTDFYKHGVKEKFKQYPDLKEVLLATYPKVILRLKLDEQKKLVSNPDKYWPDERRHWSEFALIEVRDEMLGKDSGAELALNSPDARQKSRRDKKRAGDEHSDADNKQKKAKHRQSLPDHFVNDVSSLFDDVSMENDNGSQDEAGEKGSKSSKTLGGHDKLKVASVEKEPEMDWFENGQSTSETSSSEHKKTTLAQEKKFEERTRSENRHEKKDEKRTGSENRHEKKGKERTGSENKHEKKDEKRTGSENRLEKRGKEESENENEHEKMDTGQTGDSNTLENKNKDQTGSENRAKKRDMNQTGSGSRDKKDEEQNGDEKGPEKMGTEETGSKNTSTKNNEEQSGSGSTRQKRNTNESTGSENSHKSKKSKKKKSKKDSHVSETDKMNSPDGTPKKFKRESSQDGASSKGRESAENNLDETKPTKNYRKLKFSSLPKDKRYTFIQNTNPLSFEAECKFTIDDVPFNSVNHFTAYKKAELFGDDFTKGKIKGAVDSTVLRKLDREVKKFDPKTWFANHVEIHKQACEAKFSQNPELKLQLFDTYPTIIHISGKATRGRVTDIDHASLDKIDRSNKQDINNVLTNVRDELMRKEELID